MGLIFSLLYGCILSPLFWSTKAESTLVVNIKIVHLDMFLDEVERVVQVWFKNLINQGCKVGMMLKSGKVTIIICEWKLNFPLI
jgi:hypothetical protein